MARDKERAINPATAQRKADKQKALKKGKAAVAAQRTERLANRNPQRLQAQIEALKTKETSSGLLSTQEKKTLSGLEKDVIRIQKAKELHGKPMPYWRSNTHYDQLENSNTRLGKRHRRSEHKELDFSSDTEEDARNIPMPRDTPPHVSSRRNMRVEFGKVTERDNQKVPKNDVSKLEDAKLISQTVYESSPVVRDLRREAVSFLPAAVRRNIQISKAQTQGKYPESEELDALEKQGYTQCTVDEGPQQTDFSEIRQQRYSSHNVQIEDVEETRD